MQGTHTQCTHSPLHLYPYPNACALFSLRPVHVVWCAQVDNDMSGLITYDELKQVVRQKFKVKRSEFSELALKQLWCAIDTDCSDSIAQIEFGRFIKLSKGRVAAVQPRVFRYASYA